MKTTKATFDRCQQLRRLIKEKNRAIKKAPRGRLELATMRGKPHYYKVETENAQVKRTYLGKKDVKLVGELAQKAYDREVLRLAEQELHAWEMLAKYFPNKTVEEVYDTLSPARQKFVTPIRPTDEEYRRQWESVTYEPGYFKPGAAVYLTDRGERVRSKSEQLIANLLNRLGIPYRYEYPTTILVHGREKVWRPDFLLLDVRTRKEYYLEHFGRLGEKEYAENAFEKMKIYEENGMYEGSNMLYSFETDEVPLDLQLVERKVRRALHL